MNPMFSKLSPSITSMIRMDHSAVLSTFHKYRADTPPQIKQGIVNTVALALEVHAQLEEEIFYPAMRETAPDAPGLAKSLPEHEEMKRLIGELRTRQPTDADYDSLFQELMRDVMHHVADEETLLLPEAERLLGDRLREMGARMTRRRMELSAPRAGEMASNMIRSTPASTMLMVAAGAVIAGTYVARRAFAARH